VGDIKQRVQDPVQYMRDDIALGGLESSGRFYGVYRGIVVDNEDPEKRGRCRIMLPILGVSEEANVPDNYWALPASPGLSVGKSGAHGVYFPADVGDQVWVMFERGSRDRPIYLGGWLPDNQFSGTDLIDDKALKKGMRTSTGHYIRLDDSNNSITIAQGDGSGGVSGAQVALTENGEALISNDKGSHVFLSGEETNIVNSDGSLISVGQDEVKLITKSGTVFTLKGGNVTIIAAKDITMKAGGKITLDAAGVDIGPSNQPYEPVVKGQTYSAMWLTHQHTTTAPGSPTAPGVITPLAPAVGLSLGVRVS